MKEAMNNKIYSLILGKLDEIEKHLSSKEKELKIYNIKKSKALERLDLLLAGLKSTRTSFEILRDEIEELHELSVILFKKEKL